MRTGFPIAILVSLIASSASAADVWPQFRGPTGQGDALEERLPLEWSETKGIKWKTPLSWTGLVIARRRWRTDLAYRRRGEGQGRGEADGVAEVL